MDSLSLVKGLKEWMVMYPRPSMYMDMGITMVCVNICTFTSLMNVSDQSIRQVSGHGSSHEMVSLYTLPQSASPRKHTQIHTRTFVYVCQ